MKIKFKQLGNYDDDFEYLFWTPILSLSRSVMMIQTFFIIIGYYQSIINKKYKSIQIIKGIGGLLMIYVLGLCLAILIAISRENIGNNWGYDKKNSLILNSSVKSTCDFPVQTAGSFAFLVAYIYYQAFIQRYMVLIVKKFRNTANSKVNFGIQAKLKNASFDLKAPLYVIYSIQMLEFQDYVQSFARIRYYTHYPPLYNQYNDYEGTTQKILRSIWVLLYCVWPQFVFQVYKIFQTKQKREGRMRARTVSLKDATSIHHFSCAVQNQISSLTNCKKNNQKDSVDICIKTSHLILERCIKAMTHKKDSYEYTRKLYNDLRNINKQKHCVKSYGIDDNTRTQSYIKFHEINKKVIIDLTQSNAEDANYSLKTPVSLSKQDSCDPRLFADKISTPNIKTNKKFSTNTPDFHSNLMNIDEQKDNGTISQSVSFNKKDEFDCTFSESPTKTPKKFDFIIDKDEINGNSDQNLKLNFNQNIDDNYTASDFENCNIKQSFFSSSPLKMNISTHTKIEEAFSFKSQANLEKNIKEMLISYSQEILMKMGLSLEPNDYKEILSMLSANRFGQRLDSYNKEFSINGQTNIQNKILKIDSNKKLYLGKYIFHFIELSAKKYLINHFLKDYLEHLYINDSCLQKIHILQSYSNSEGYRQNTLISSQFDRKNPCICIKIRNDIIQEFIYDPFQKEFKLKGVQKKIPEYLRLDCRDKLKIRNIVKKDMEFLAKNAIFEYMINIFFYKTGDNTQTDFKTSIFETKSRPETIVENQKICQTTTESNTDFNEAPNFGERTMQTGSIYDIDAIRKTTKDSQTSQTLEKTNTMPKNFNFPKLDFKKCKTEDPKLKKATSDNIRRKSTNNNLISKPQLEDSEVFDCGAKGQRSHDLKRLQLEEYDQKSIIKSQVWHDSEEGKLQTKSKNYEFDVKITNFVPISIDNKVEDSHRNSIKVNFDENYATVNAEAIFEVATKYGRELQKTFDDLLD